MAPTDDQLLSHGTFLRRLAYALVRDEHEAEDVVQDTYLAALRKPPRGSALAWLTSTVRNLARRRVRDRRRRDQRERTAARRDVHAPTAEIAAQLELQRRVVAKLTKLEEPYREAIVLRFYYGQAPSQIARDHGLPVDTVKTRLRRGLQKLRAQLDAEHGGERRVWALSLMSIAIPGQAASLAAIHGGVLAMKLKLVWVAALLSGICVFLFWNAGGSGEPERRGLRAKEPIGPSESAAADATTGIEDRGPDTRSAPAAPGQTVLLEGTVILATGERGEPVELEVRAESQQRELSEDRLRVSVRSGEGFRVDVGRFFADKLPFAVAVTARHPGYVAKTVRRQVMIDALDGRPVVAALEMTLPKGRLVQGTVLGPGGTLPSVTVAAYRLLDGIPDETSAASTATKEGGHFRLAVEEGGSYLVVAVALNFRPAAQVADLRIDEILHLPPLILRTGRSISGAVTRTGRSPAVGTELTARLVAQGLLLGLPDGSGKLSWTLDRVEHGLVSVPTDESGSYSVGGLYETAYRISVKAAKGTHFGVFLEPAGPRYMREVTAPASGVDFEIEQTTLEILVRHAGKGLPHASVTVTDLKSDSQYGWNYETEPGGKLTVQVRPEADYVIEVGPQGFVSQERRVRSAQPGGTTPVVFDLSRTRAKATLMVDLEPAGDGPFPPLPPIYSFELTPAAGGRAVHLAVTAKGTRFVLRNLDPGDYRLVARTERFDPREGGYYLAAEAAIRLTAGATTQQVLSIRPGGRIQVTVRSAEGRTDLPAACWLETPHGKRIDLRFAKYAEGSSTVTSGRLPAMRGPAYGMNVLSPGLYRLHLKPLDESYHPQSAEVHIEAGKTTEIVLALDR